MAEALLGTVIQNLGSFVKDQLATFWGVDQQTEKLCSNLSAIHAVLKDAERKQITSHAVKDWVQKLTDAAYVLEDILDDCSIHSKKVQCEGQSSCVARYHPKDILFRCQIGERMKNISQRFDIIHEERRKFELHAGVKENQPEDDDEWRQTSSVITEPVIYGRDQDREKIVQFLVEHACNNEELSIYSIVGMGGLGKTALAKQVFNNDRVTKHFDLTIWVCVSNDFNMKRILQSIIESITEQNPNLMALEQMQLKVQKVLQGKRYLLVLDDVWNEDEGKWMELKGVLQSASGTKGTALLVTTRLEKVALIMETYPSHHLTELSENDSWSLFKHHAFGPNREESEELVAIGKEIVKKCVGLPLAIKTMGSLLRYETQVKEWQNAMESEIWNIREEDSVMRALKLSYVNLELSLRRCFTFCAIFPKGSEIVKEDLIHLWMANGFIKSEGSLQVEDIGNKVWEKLYSRSFFQEAKAADDALGIITSFKMHDLFHDLAQSIMGEECKVSEHTRLTHLSTRVHHLHSLKSHKEVNMSAFVKVESLRTFLDFIPEGISIEYFRQLPSNHSLRALRTSSGKLSPLKGLAHLRYLHLKHSTVTSLPNFTNGLLQLQALKLEDILLRCLPKDLTRLQDLRHLVIKDCPSLAEMPPNIGKLSHLRTLSKFIVGSKPGHGLAELHALKLSGKLHISGLENVPSEWDAKQANLMSKKELKRLYFSWGLDENLEGGVVNVERILEALKPPSTLKSFGVRGYHGIQLPSWMRNVSVLKELVEVILYNCMNCDQLPPLGKLPHLKRLFISGMRTVKHLDIESYDGVEEKAFPSLEKLTLGKLPKLEGILRDEGVETLPILSQLSINGVPNIKLPSLPSIEKLHVMDTEDVASFIEEVVWNMPCLKTLKIEACKNLKVLPDQLGRLGGELEELKIKHCYELESFPEHVLQGLTSLRTLEIKFCKKLKSLSEGMRHLSCLERLHVEHCPELMSLPSNMNQLTALREVSIEDSTIPEGLQCIQSLQTLLIQDCKCTSLPDWLGDITSLQELKIYTCLDLKSLPSSFQRLTNLRKLIIYEPSWCVSLRCKRETGKDWKYIAHIPQVEISGQLFDTICEAILLTWRILRQIGLRTTLKVLQDYHFPERDAFERMIDD